MRKYLCVTEKDPNDVFRWRMFAQYIDRLPDIKPFFKELTGNPQYLNANVPVTRGDVRVLEFSQDRLTPTGLVDAREVPAGLIVEVVEPVQLKELVLEDADAVRQALKAGVNIPDPAYRAFKSGSSHLALSVPSKTGRMAALLLTDPGKVRSVANTGTRFTIVIENTPSNGLRTMDSVPVIYLDQVNTLKYAYAGGPLTRVFLESEPEATGTAFMPYSYADYAPLLFSRVLARAKNRHVLADGRNLTKTDVQAIIAVVEQSLEDADQIGETLQIRDPDVVRQVVDGVKALLPDVRAKMTVDDELTRGVKDLLLDDPEIRAKLVEDVRAQWLAGKSAERAAAQKQLDGVLAANKRAHDENERLEAARAGLQDRLDALNGELEITRTQAEQARQKATEVVDRCRHDMLELSQAAGLGGYCLPDVTPAVRQDGVKESRTALAANLGSFLTPKDAADLAACLLKMAAAGICLAVDQEYAYEIARALSMADAGTTPAIIARVDDQVPFDQLKKAVLDAEGHVVLVEGVFACAQDHVALGLIRKCPGKLLVFSVDQPENLDAASPALFTRALLVTGLPVTSRRHEAKYAKLPGGIPMPGEGARFGIPSFPEAGHEGVAKVLMSRRHERTRAHD